MKKLTPTEKSKMHQELLDEYSRNEGANSRCSDSAGSDFSTPKLLRRIEALIELEPCLKPYLAPIWQRLVEYEEDRVRLDWILSATDEQIGYNFGWSRTAIDEKIISQNGKGKHE